MRSIVAALLTLLIISSSTALSKEEDNKDDFDLEFKTQLRDDDPRKQGLANALQVYAGCKELRWACQKPCRAQIPLKGNDSILYCTNPHPKDTCFGLPIDYNYVPSREQLPAEYEVLRRFPKCWSVLGPMLCGIIYRPCGVYEFTARLTSTTSKMEIWQRFGIGMCVRVHDACSDAIKEGFFPSELIDCKRTVENITWAKERTNSKGELSRYVPSGNEEELKTEWDRQTVFTEEACLLNYQQTASKFEDMQCIFPLVYTRHETIKPIIDKCFLPCRNPLISSPDKFLSFRVIRAVICAFFAIVCLSIFVFLCSRSKIFVDSDCIFSIACCNLSFAVYLTSWALGSITFFAEAAECTTTADSVVIRSTLESTWCSISAVISHSSLLASIGFLAASFPLSAAGASKAVERDRKERDRKKSDKSAAGFRAKLVLLVVVLSIAAAIAALALQWVATDGVAGVCSVGLHSITHHMVVVAFPGIFVCLIALGWGTWDIWKEKKQRKAEVEQTIEEKIREGIDHEKAKKKVEFWKDRSGQQKEDIQEQTRQGSLPPLEEGEGESTGKGEGEEEILVLQGDDDEKEWLTESQKQEIEAAVRLEHLEEWRGKEKRAWYGAISSRYTLVALCICIGSLLFGLCIHYTFLANDGRAEHDAIRAYVTCVMSKSIVRKDLHWLSEPVHASEMWLEGKGENDPLVRRHNLASELVIHSCLYPSTGDGRIFGLLTVFVGLPLLPICVFIWAFVAGLIGVGGMVTVKTRRPRPMKRSNETDVEMTALTTERDDDSQMMSSASSAVSSAPSSVSLRGELPRFSSTERLINVGAPPPVPSEARSEQADEEANRRSRTVGHHRVLDVMGRARERREKSNKNRKKRATAEEINARREGIAESGRLPAPRNSLDVDCTRSTVSTHSAASRGLMSTASSTMVPPSEAGLRRAMMRNAEAATGGRSRQANRGTALQQQLQMVQEELLLCAVPRDGENANGIAQPDGSTFLQQLIDIRQAIQLYLADPLHFDAAQNGMMVSGLAISLARTSIANNTSDMRANTDILHFAVERLQGLAFHLESNLNLSPQMTEDVAAAINVLRNQISFNNAPNARELLEGQQTEHLQLDALCPERDALRQAWQRAAGDDDLQAKIYEQMLTEARRRFFLGLMGRRQAHEQHNAQLQLEPAAAAQQPMQQAQMQGGGGGNGAIVGRPPVYSPMQTIDLRLPPEGSDVRSEASYSVTGSSQPSSLLTTAEEDDQIRLYHETFRQPPIYEGQATSAAPPPAADAAAAAESADVHDFLTQVLQMNGRSTQPPAYARQTGHFSLPTNNETESSSVLSDGMSSETSMDSIGRRTAPSAIFSCGSFGIPVYDIQPERAAQSSRAAPTSSAQNGSPFPLFALPNTGSGSLPPVPMFPNSQPLGVPNRVRDPMDQAREQMEKLSLFGNGEAGKKKKDKKRKAPPLEEQSSSKCKIQDDGAPPRRDPPQPPPPGVNRVKVVGRRGGNAAAAEVEARSNSRDQMEEERREREDSDSGIESLDSLAQCNLRLYVEDEGNEGGGARPATKEELERYAKTVQRQIEERFLRREEQERNEAGPSNERRRRERALLMNRYLNHSNPDLAMEEEERERREAEDREREERRRVEDARVQQREARVGRDNEMEADDESITSALTAEEQRELVLALRDSLAQRSTEGMEPRHQRLVAHLRRALDDNGGISREEIMRFRVEETNRESRARQEPNANSPYSVSSVVISRMSLGEIGARADAIRALSTSNIYPLEVYYQLHLADVLWPLAGRDVAMGDNVYTHDEINRVLGADSPVVPAGADGEDFHQLMRKRAITAASLTGRAYGRKRGSEGFQYQPPRLPDMGLYQLLGDPSVILSAIDGDMDPLRDAIDRIPMTMPDVMRLDLRTERTLGSHLRHFRDYLDSRARMVGYELRDDTYHDVVPPEPTGSRRPQRAAVNVDVDRDEEEEEEDDAPDPDDDDPEEEPDF